MKLKDLGAFSSNLLNKKVEQKFGYRFNTKGLTAEKAQKMLAKVEENIRSYKKNNGNLLTERSAHFSNLMLIRDSLKNYLLENKNDDDYKNPDKERKCKACGTKFKPYEGEYARCKDCRDEQHTQAEIATHVESKRPVTEKAKSKAQQKFMGMVYAAKKGEKPASKEVAKAAKGMSKKDAKDFAKTKHKGLPDKKEGVGESVNPSWHDKKGVASQQKKFKSDLSKMSKKDLKSLKKEVTGKDLDAVNKALKRVKPQYYTTGPNKGKKIKIGSGGVNESIAPKETVRLVIQRALGKHLVWKPGWSKMYKNTRYSRTERVDDYVMKGIKVVGVKIDNHLSANDKKSPLAVHLKKELIRAGYKPHGDILIFDDTVMFQTRKPIQIKESKINMKKADLLKLKRAAALSESGKAVPAKYLSSLKEAVARMQARRSLLEGEVEQAQAILAAKDLVDRLQGMLEDVGQMMNEDLPPLTDSVRDQIGGSEASSFNSEATAALNGLLDTLRQTREQIDGATRSLAGDQDNSMPMPSAAPTAPGAGLDSQIDSVADLDTGDEFSGADAAVGGEAPLGREKR